MGTLVDAIQDVVMTESETEVQTDPTQHVDGTIETQLAEEINTLWSDHVRLSANRKVTAAELRQIRASLAERLHSMKSLLSRPGRGGQWRSWLRERGIPRSTADRLVARHAEAQDIENGNVPSGAISELGEANAEKLANNLWLRIGKLLTTGESVVQFIDRIAELSGVGHERRADGLVIFIPVPAPATDPAPQPSEEVTAIAEEPREEPAAASTELGLAVAAAETNSGNVA